MASGALVASMCQFEVPWSSSLLPCRSMPAHAEDVADQTVAGVARVGERHPLITRRNELRHPGGDAS